jgi:hypothetical protein
MNIQQAIHASTHFIIQWLAGRVGIIAVRIVGRHRTSHRGRCRGHKLNDKPRYLGDCEGIMIEEKTGMRLGQPIEKE